jgi:type II secretory pathway pseudopilin PulG
MTLIELTVVILVLLSLLTILFIGARAWKRGSDRAACILQIRQVQIGVRSFANMNGYVADQAVAPLDLESEVIGPGKFLESTPFCPAGGTYTFKKNQIPRTGSVYMKCSLDKDQDHHPKHPHKSW